MQTYFKNAYKRPWSAVGGLRNGSKSSQTIVFAPLLIRPAFVELINIKDQDLKSRLFLAGP